ncbi:MAG: hypothetical protein JW894_10585 [Bacteroidales bacterium]|nr:hypothetical protein [Bacteroidales bacterium]
MRKRLRKMGLISDQTGILSRYIREEHNWLNHLNNTKQFILDCLSQNNAETISVFGSGWLLDLPEQLLSERSYKKVVLYDLHHPVEVKRKFRNYHHIFFEEIDLTGGLIEKVYLMTKKRGSFSEEKIITESENLKVNLPIETDYYISLNILNQLDILIIDYLKSRIKISDTTILKLRKLIQANHRELLKKNKSCLVTDYEELSINKNGDVVGTKTLVHIKLPEGKRIKKWMWKFDTQKTYHPGFNTYFNVIGIEI